MRKSILVLIIGVVALGGGMAVRYFTNQPTKLDIKPSESVVPASSPQLFNCGSGGPDTSSEDSELIRTCAALNFKKCSPASWYTSLDLGPLGGFVTYYYEIIGPQNDWCLVKSKFTKNPNPEFVGPEMQCGYDNTRDFETALQDTSKCTGPLYTLLFAGSPKPTEAIKQPDGPYGIEDTAPLGTFEIKF